MQQELDVSRRRSLFMATNFADEQGSAVETLRRRNVNLRRVNEVSQQLTAILDEAQIMTFLLQASAEIIGAPAASLWMWQNDTKQNLVCRATHPASGIDILRPYKLDANEGVAGWVVTHQQSTVADAPYADQRFKAEIDTQTGFTTQSLLAVPLRLHDSVIGVIEILNKAEAKFDEEDLQMVETLAAAAAIALENARLVQDLRAQKTLLQAQNSELDAFAHTVAHDLKTPLSMVLGFSDFLQDVDFAVTRQELRQTMRSIATNAHKMNNIIQEILLLSGVRKVDIKPQPFDMKAVVSESQTRLAHMFNEYKATVSGSSQWPTVLGYGPWIEEVWVNYISNALKYGGSPPTVELGFTEEDDWVWFWVKDNGAGLTPEQQSQLFVPFARLEQVRVKGHGLGLSIVQRILAKLGGEVAIESVVGEGSTFMFKLPKAAE